MGVRVSKPKEEIVIDLTGQQGNAFFLLGTAKNLSKKLGYDSEKTNEILEQMKASDYNHLVITFEYHFGDYVVLEMSEELKNEIFPA